MQNAEESPLLGLLVSEPSSRKPSLRRGLRLIRASEAEMVSAPRKSRRQGGRAPSSAQEARETDAEASDGDPKAVGQEPGSLLGDSASQPGAGAA